MAFSFLSLTCFFSFPQSLLYCFLHSFDKKKKRLFQQELKEIKK
ncbi:putative signal peptide protein [Puccinia sorghi]|uniref:Putative signal peptide protein n=1 Tax=Puccinia sorghi TaxID=27349 RepID=A0A0L6U976_9BASI|nr:putative signal peptide protein [Puccinia sorghi]